MSAALATRVYEVNADIDAGIEAAYRAWLPGHIAQILAIDGFTAAAVHEVADPPAPAGRVHLCMQFHLRDAAALEAYLRDHAPRLRADGVARFGDAMRATRRVLVPHAG